MRFVVAAAIVCAPSLAMAEVHTSIHDVRACSVAADGRITLATTGGVATLRADGSIERVLTALDGLPDGRAHSLTSIGDDLWIGTERGAAVLSKGKVARTVAAPPVRAIAAWNNGVYLGTWGKGVLRVDGGEVPFAAPGNPLRARVSALTTFEGALVAATAAGAFRVEQGKLAALPGAPTTATFAVAAFNDRLYLGGLTGLVSLRAGVLRSESDADVRALSALDGELLAATFGAGVLRVGKASTIGSATFAQALGGAGARRCVGTAEGVHVTDGKTWSTFARDGLPSNDVAAIAVDGARVWVGTFDRGLAVVEGGVARAVPGVERTINALAVQGDRLFIATARGLARREKSGAVRTFTEADGLPSSDVHAVLALSQGVLVGTSKGAAILRGDQLEPLGKKQGVTGDAVWALAERDGELYLGSNNGLFIGKPGQKFRRLSKLTGELPDDWVTALLVEGDAITVGTYAGGAIKLQGSSFTRIAPGYVNPDGLRRVNGKLYIATMNGLFTHDGDKLERVTRGVLGEDVTAVRASSKGLVIATRRGLTLSG